MMNATTTKKQVRFSNSSIVYVFNTLSLTEEQASKLWYSKDETDRFKVWHSRRLQQIRSHLSKIAALSKNALPSGRCFNSWLFIKGGREFVFKKQKYNVSTTN